MTIQDLRDIWLNEELRTFAGWNFSSIADRTSEQGLDWDYRSIVLSHLKPKHTLLDMGTGGGELLLSLSPPSGRTYATESYPPNYELCLERLPVHGITVRHVTDDDNLPFADTFFDLVINRQASFDAQEVYRVLRPGGLFITQQVGGQNNLALTHRLLGEDASRTTDPNFSLKSASRKLREAGFTIEDRKECYPILRFYDVGALVYYAKIIEWEFPNFSVERYYDRLCKLQEEVGKHGYVESREHRFFILATKAEGGGTHDH
jgi:SAM-dependent methyltransferase